MHIERFLIQNITFDSVKIRDLGIKKTKEIVYIFVVLNNIHIKLGEFFSPLDRSTEQYCFVILSLSILIILCNSFLV